MTQHFDIPAPSALEPYVEPYLDDTLARIRPHETPLLSLALSRARKAKAEAEAIAPLSVKPSDNPYANSAVALAAEAMPDAELRTKALAEAVVTCPEGTPALDHALVAEAAIAEYKRQCNYDCWDSAMQTLSDLTEPAGEWSAAKFLDLAKKFFTAREAPAAGVLFASSGLVDALHGIDWSGSLAVPFERVADPCGLTLTRAHTLYGDIDIVRDPALDTLGWSNDGALLSLAHATRYKRLPAEDAAGICLCDCLVLEGTCHIWIDGAGD